MRRGGEGHGSGSLAPSAAGWWGSPRSPQGGPAARFAFLLGAQKSMGRMGSGRPLLLSPHPPQSNAPTPTPRSQSPSKRMSLLFPRDVQ